MTPALAGDAAGVVSSWKANKSAAATEAEIPKPVSAESEADAADADLAFVSNSAFNVSVVS